ncbi:MAG: hypothetical protein HY880_03180 [Deltaproteobacteria bacterium]|nr:hypothetical protein [Deltaproteobacteria bacterium]
MGYFAVFLMFLFLSSPLYADPLPDVKVNGSDGPVYATSGDSVTVSISLDPMERAGQNADWWVGARTRYGWYGHDKATGNWVYAGASPDDLLV